MKICNGCKRRLDPKAFPLDVTRKDGRHSRCRDCKHKRQREIRGDATAARVVAGGETMASFGSPIERECALAVQKHCSIEKAAGELRLTVDQVRAHLATLQGRASRRGWSPLHDMFKPVPAGFSVRGVSTLYDASGAVKQQWVKSKQEDQDRLAAIVDAMTHAAGAWKGKAKPVARPKSKGEDLLCCYPLGDPHIGMYAYAAETGANFDIEIAERNIVDAMDRLVALAPSSKQALIVSLGDFYHMDNSSNRTMRSGHALDVDTRYSKVLGVGVRAMRRLIDRALEKHEHVKVVCAIGNHDDSSSLFLSIALQQFYEREPRVEIDSSQNKFHWHRFGANLIGITHGDSIKAGDLPGIMAHDRAKDWGETLHRFWLCGHVHHDSLKEYPGVTVETFRTLASRDAWSHGSGYRAQRDAKVMVLHREHGQVMRHIVGIEQLAAA